MVIITCWGLGLMHTKCINVSSLYTFGAGSKIYF